MVQIEDRALDIYRKVVIGLGAAALMFTISRLGLADLSPSYLLYSVLTIAVASRVGVKIPGVKGFISVSDTFIRANFRHYCIQQFYPEKHANK